MTPLLPLATTACVLATCVISAKRGPQLHTVVALGFVVLGYSWGLWAVTR